MVQVSSIHHPAAESLKRFLVVVQFQAQILFYVLACCKAKEIVSLQSEEEMIWSKTLLKTNLFFIEVLDFH